MLKNICLVVIMLFCWTSAQNYTPLNRSERKAFIKAVEAIKIAAGESSYSGVMRFGPGILAKYESILLDPACKNLRASYEFVEKTVREAALSQIVDTFELNLKRLVEAGEWYNAMNKYDEYFDYLTEKGNDSLIVGHEPAYRECMIKYFDGTFETLTKLASLRHSDKVLLDSLRNVVEISLRELFVSISSSNNIEDLLNFKTYYPGLFSEDIDNMIESLRAKMRLSLKRRPNIEKIEYYLAIFPEKERMVDSLYQKMLYNDFKKNPDMISASKYLSHFPDGKFSRELRTFIDVQQEQQRIVQLQQLRKIGSQGNE